MKSATEHSNQKPPTSAELLSRTVPFYEGSGGGFNKQRSVSHQNYQQIQKEEDILTSRFLLVEYKTIANALGLNFQDYIGRVYSDFFVDGAMESLKCDWLTNSANITVDIGDRIIKYLYHCEPRENDDNNRSSTEEFNSNINKALRLIENREWHTLSLISQDSTIKIASHRVYSFLRWYCRIGLVDILFNIHNRQQTSKNLRQDTRVSVIEKLFYEFVTLEHRIINPSLIVEGIRVIKNC